MACGGRPDLEDHAGHVPELEMQEFFAGKLKPYGVFWGLFDDVRRSSVADLDGTWDGTILTLVEDFVYEDGSPEQRIWRLSQTGPESWKGSAEGVIDEASSEESGNAFN